MRKLMERKLENARNDLYNVLSAQRQIEYERSHFNLWTEETYKKKMDELFFKEQQLLGCIAVYAGLLNCKELSEMESKVEKYDELLEDKKSLSEMIYADLKSENKKLKAKVKKSDGDFADMYAKKEMEIGRLSGKIYDLKCENKVLKEALKSLKKAFEFRNPKDFTNDDYYVLYQIAEIDSLCEDYSIIKKALEVIENE